MIGLAEAPEDYDARGYSLVRNAQSQRRFRRFGMPLAAIPKPRMHGTSRACRAIVAVRLSDPAREWEALRAMQALQFLTGDPMDDDAAIARALGDDVAARIDDPEVLAEYERDRALARSASGTPAEAQGKTASTDGPVRFTAPSVVFASGGRELVAGGYQPLAAYDVLLANLEPGLERRPPPEDPAEALSLFTGGVYTAEVAEVHATREAGETDPAAIEHQLIAAAAEGRARRQGDRWLAASTL